MGFFEQYNNAKEERAKLGIPPLPLTNEQTKEVCGKHMKKELAMLKF